jgi:endonuclease/exonuclease/phosphatase family metal-dependent hydrolase
MPKIKLLLVPLLASFLLGCSSTTRLTVLTYNIHHAEGMDKKLDLPRIARVIGDKADLVALQEVDNGTTRTNRVDQTATLGKPLKMNSAFGKAMDHLGGQYGNAVLSRSKIKQQRTIPLPFSGGQHEPRCALVTRVGTKAGDVLFVSTHLDHLNEPNDRATQMREIVAQLQGEKLPIILAGDFNCRPGSEPLQLLDQSWLRATDDSPSIPVVNPRSKIDHVFVRPAKRWKVIETHVIDEQVASDHRPVVVTLELSK